jgi:hypothetical protein
VCTVLKKVNLFELLARSGRGDGWCGGCLRGWGSCVVVNVVVAGFEVDGQL